MAAAEESSASPCPRCKGNGVCLECGGTGEVTCLSCEGAGQRTTPRGRTFTCKTCGGKGKVACVTVCSSCGGSGQITEQMQRAVREKYQVKFYDYSPTHHASLILLFINVAIYMFIDIEKTQGPVVWRWMVNTPDSVALHEYWRFFTPMFLHVNLMHLAFNSIFLLQYCPQMEGAYGTRMFVLLYLLSGLSGDVLSWFGHHGWAGVGASGALFGVGAAYVGLQRRFHMFDSNLIWGWTIYLVGFLIMGFGMETFGPGSRIDNWGHLGGALAGLAFALLAPRPAGRNG